MNQELPDDQAGFRKGRGTRDHFKKIRDTKGTFYAKMSTIKDKNSMDLTEAGFPRWFSGKESTCQCKRCRFNLWVRKIFYCIVLLCILATSS